MSKIFRFSAKDLDALGRYAHSLSLFSVATFVGLLLKDGEFTKTTVSFLVSSVLLLAQGIKFFRASRRKEEEEKREGESHG